MRAVGHVLPPSYIFENLRSVVGGHGYSGSGLLIGTALTMADVAVEEALVA